MRMGVSRRSRFPTTRNRPLPLTLPVLPAMRWESPAGPFQFISTGNSTGIRGPARGCLVIENYSTGTGKSTRELSRFPPVSQEGCCTNHPLLLFGKLKAGVAGMDLRPPSTPRRRTNNQPLRQLPSPPRARGHGFVHASPGVRPRCHVNAVRPLSRFPRHRGIAKVEPKIIPCFTTDNDPKVLVLWYFGAMRTARHNAELGTDRSPAASPCFQLFSRASCVPGNGRLQPDPALRYAGA